MVGLGPYRADSHQPKPARSHQQGNFPNPEHGRNEKNRRFREGSVNTTQTSRSHSRVGSHISQKQDNEQAMQREINDLKRKLRLAQRRQSPLAWTHFSTTKTMTTVGKGQGPLQARLSLMWKSITKGVNAEALLQGACDTMSRALDQFSRSPFTRRIEEVTLPRRF